LWPNRNLELEGDALRAEGLVQAADAEIKATLADAAGQIIEARKELVRRLLEPLQDPQFAEWVIPRAPLVSEAERFKAFCGGDVQGAVGLSLEQISDIISAGQIPKLSPQENRLQAAALAHLSNQPYPNY
jgi:hypothetical protein